MVSHVSVEVAKTVLEVADVAWTAMECCQHHHHRHHHEEKTPHDVGKETEIESLRLENQRLKCLLQQNLNLLQNITSASPSLAQDCPPDLHARLLAAVDSKRFLDKLESLDVKDTSKFPFKEPSGEDLETADILVNVDKEEPSWWVWVTDDMAPSNIEERSGIDNDNYLVVSEEHVVEGVANFMARCIMSNQNAKNMSPQELQKTLTKALGGMNKVEKMMHVWHAGKIFYTLSTWGLAFAGLYRSRAVLRLAAMGVHSTSKVVLKAL